MKGLVTVRLWPCAWFPCLDAGGRTPQLDYSLPEESKHSHLPVSFSTSGCACAWVAVLVYGWVRLRNISITVMMLECACAVERIFLMWIVYGLLVCLKE